MHAFKPVHQAANVSIDFSIHVPVFIVVVSQQTSPRPIFTYQSTFDVSNIYETEAKLVRF